MIGTSFLHFRNSKLPYKVIYLPLSVQRTYIGLSNVNYILLNKSRIFIVLVSIKERLLRLS